MHLPLRIGIPKQPANIDNALNKRASGNGPNLSGIIIAICAGLVFLIILVWAFFRFRIKRSLKKPHSKQHAYAPAGVHDDSLPGNGRRSQTNSSNNPVSQTGGDNPSTATVDRNTSVRSVLTLPAYRTKANDNEQVLGREGERGGVDVVVDLPTAEDHEALREDEMETMYQIRLARRSQIADREERRQLRREARQRGDNVALRELNERARAASQSNVVNDLREEQQRLRNQRERAVSSVSYEGLGVARHDGTRLRANSQESERVGLLSDAASIALSTRSPSALSHRRDRSTSSVLSFDSREGFPRSGATTPRRLSAQHSGGTAGSSPEIIGEADLGEFDMPAHDPPTYDDVSLHDVRSGATTPVNFNEPPPGYPGPAQERAQGLDAHVAGMAEIVDTETDLGYRRPSELSRNSSTSSGPIPFPRLPSLSLERIPQIVVEPSTAYPRERSTDR